MARRPWTDEENDKVVEDYFAMLKADFARRRYSKAGHNRELQTRIQRSRASIEYKHQNISAVLQGLGEDWLSGYVPASNFQIGLAHAVQRWLDRNEGWVNRLPTDRPAAGASEALPHPAPPGTARLPLMTPPTLSNLPPPKDLEKKLRIAQQFDVAGRDERNRALGKAGEERVLAHERAVLLEAGRDDLAEQVRWVSQEEGDGAGYDIASFDEDGRSRLIEVKTTNGRWERTPFHISRNELAVADEWPDQWRLFRLWNFAREPQAFELRPPLTAHVSLMPTSFLAEFR